MTGTRAAGSDLLVDLRRARDHIDRNYAAALDLDSLAAVAGISTYHFVRCFEARSCRPRTWSSCRSSERPYGVEAVMRDVSGNWLVLVEPRAFSPADFA